MTDAGYHTPVEEYAEAIFTLGEEGTAVIAARLAERLDRSAPSVSEMLDRMEVDGLLFRNGRSISLTSEGIRLAETVIRRHRLAERLLVDVIGLEWHKAHVEAGRWEHVISAAVEEKLIALLGNPTTCPHGNPIPGSPAGPARIERSLDLEEMPGLVDIVRISESLEYDEGSMASLERVGAIPGKSATLRFTDAQRELVTAEGVLEVNDALAAQLFVAVR
ncbi:MAG: metal-dependent transcriptional regulator [Actinomycetes bacterium]